MIGCARYLIRFDDVCESMEWSKWSRIEECLRKNNIQPIIAVIPKNQDNSLVYGDLKDDFWERVRWWQSKGWCIAMHGYTHTYETSNPGILGLNRYSEFAGLSYDEQFRRISLAKKVFDTHNVVIDAWIAPAHSFDLNTIKALKNINVDLISDGFTCFPFTSYGARWIPQQLWRFRWMPFGVWTVCIHPSTLSETGLKELVAGIERYKTRLTSVSELCRSRSFHRLSLTDRMIWFIYLGCLRIKRLIA